MKDKWMWLIIVLVVVLIAASVGFRVWYLSPGIRVVGNELHAEITGKCYIIDEADGQIVDETTLSINGSTSSADGDLFDGELKVLGYQNSASGTITSLKSIERKQDGIWTITHIDNCTHQENVDGIIRPMEHFCDYHYTYYLRPDDPEFVVVLIDSFEQSKPQYAVLASDEAEAMARYNEFIS